MLATGFYFILAIISLKAQSGTSNSKRQYFSEIDLFNNGSDGYACFRIPAIVTSPNGDLLAFAEGRVNGCSDFGDVDIVLRRSKNNGASWEQIEILIDQDRLQAGNPAPVVDMMDPDYPNGRIFLFYNTGDNHEYEVRSGKGIREVWFITSTDNGHSWSPPTNITAQVHRPNYPQKNEAYRFAEDWRTHANTPGHALQLTKGDKAGRIFIPANHSQKDPLPNAQDYRAYCFYSDDHGRSWEIGAEVEIPGSNESIAVELPDGRVMQNIRHQGSKQGQRIVAISSTAGASWDTVYYDAGLPSPVCQASLLAYTTPNGRDALLFSNPNNQTSRTNMTVRLSIDDGQTWPISREIRAGESAYSDLVIQQDGLIGLLYEHGNNGGIHYAHFNYSWLINGQNNTSNQWLKKNFNPQLAEPFSFQMADPVIEYDQLLFHKSTTVKLQLDLPEARIYYTLDGSEPTERSTLYTAPVYMEESATLKVRAFHDQCRPSAIRSLSFIRIGNPVQVKEATLKKQPSDQYAGKGVSTILDTKQGTLDFRDGNWLGFNGSDVELELVLDKPQEINTLIVSNLVDTGSWIFPPKQIELWLGDGQGNFLKIASKAVDEAREGMPGGQQFIQLQIGTVMGRLLKVVVRNQGKIPDWHPGAGTPAWLFIDEIVVK